MKITNEFDTIYDDLYKKNIKQLKSLKNNLKWAKVGITISITGMILTFISMLPFYNKYLLLAFIIFTLILGLSMILYNKDKNRTTEKLDFASYYKINIINELFNKVFNKAEYILGGKINSKEYEGCEWGYYDYYESKDLISTNINNNELLLSTIYTSYIDNAAGETRKRGEFAGLFGIVYLNEKVDKTFKITSIKSKNNDDNFESYYKINGNIDDSLKRFLVNIFKNSKDSVDMFLKDNKLYFRIHWFEPFEPSVFGKILKKNKIEELYKLIILIKDICETTINTLETK